MEEKEIKALISLLEDEDESISSHVEQKIRSLGKLVIPFLEQEWESNLSPDIQTRIENIVHDLQSDLRKERLIE